MYFSVLSGVFIIDVAFMGIYVQWICVLFTNICIRGLKKIVYVGNNMRFRPVLKERLSEISKKYLLTKMEKHEFMYIRLTG